MGDPIGEIKATNVAQSNALGENQTALNDLDTTNTTQSGNISANTAAVASNTAIINRFDSILTTPAQASPENPTVGPNQWYRIYVPTKNTKLTMGMQDLGSSNHDQENGERHHYSGFSVTTEGHIHVYAGNKMVLESKGPLIAQSTLASTYFGAPGDALFGAEGGVYCGGPGGIVVHGGGGLGVDPPVPDDKNAGVPNAPDAGSGVAALYADLASSWNNFDGVVASTVALKGVVSGISGIVHHKHSALLKTVVALAGAGRDAVWAKGAFDSAAAPGAMGGACINGEAGVICTTQLGIGYTSVFARNGFMIGSLAHIFQAAQNAELCGIANSALESGRLISLDAGGELELLAKKSVQVSSRRGGIHVDGSHIGIGGGGKDKQKPTFKAVVTGENVDFESADVAHVGAKRSLAVGGDTVVLKGKSKAILTAKDSALVHGGTSHILLDGKECTLGVGKSIGATPGYPTPDLGNPKAGIVVIGTDLMKDPNSYVTYADDLTTHIDKVKKADGGWVKMLFKDGKVEFAIKKFAVGFKNGDMDMGKKVDAKG